MENQPLRNQVQGLFPVFDQSELVQEIVTKGQLIDLAAGTSIMQAGELVRHVPLVLAGSIKVFREDEEGNEIFLYYIRSGESCAMTLSSCLKREKSEVKAVVQTQTSLVALPVAVVYDFTRRYPSWNDFIIDTYTKRFGEILEVVDGIAFNKMDVRLLQYLMNRARVVNSNSLKISRTDIAKDLNSSREVISRLLKQMDRNQIIKIVGNQIELLN